MKNYTQNTNLFEIGIIFLTTISFIKISSIISIDSLLENALIALSLILILVNFFAQKYSIKKILIISFLILLGMYTSFITGQSIILEIIVISLSIKNYDFNRIIRIIYKVSLIILVTHTLLFLLLVISGQESLFMDIYGRNRAAFGIIHPNLFSIYLFNLILMWTWLNFKKINSYSLITIFAILTTSFIFTDTRTSYATGLLFVILLALRNMNFFKSAVKKFTKYSFLFFSTTFFVFTVLFINNSQIALKTDNLLSGRIKFSSYGFQNYGFTALGQKVEKKIIWDDNWKLNSMTFDSLYAYLFFNIGLIWLFILLYYFKKMNYSNDKIYLYIFIWSLYSLTEIHTINCFYFFPILLFPYATDDKFIQAQKEKI